MARAYSLNLLERLVAAVQRAKAAERSHPSSSERCELVKWSQLSRATGSVAARPMDGKTGLIRWRTSAQLLALLLQIAWKKPLARPLMADGDSAFRFLFQPNRPSAVKPVANSGKLDGIGVAAAIDPSLEINKLPKLSGCPSEPNNPATES